MSVLFSLLGGITHILLMHLFQIIVVFCLTGVQKHAHVVGFLQIFVFCFFSVALMFTISIFLLFLFLFFHGFNHIFQLFNLHFVHLNALFFLVIELLFQDVDIPHKFFMKAFHSGFLK